MPIYYAYVRQGNFFHLKKSGKRSNELCVLICLRTPGQLVHAPQAESLGKVPIWIMPTYYV